MAAGERGAEQKTISGTLLLVMLTSTGATAFTGVLMVSPLLLNLADEFHTTVAVTGQLVTAGALIWAALAPFCGLLSDRYGRKPLLLLGVTTFGVFTLLSGWAIDLPTLFASRVLAAVGGAFVATNVQTCVADHFPAEQRGRALGWVISGFSLAPLIGVPLVAYVTEISDWRWAFRLVGALMLAIGAWIYWQLPRTRPMGGGSYGATFANLIHSPAVIGLLASNIGERMAYAAVTTYLAAFLMQSYGLSVGQVAPVISLVAAGAVIGTMAGGRLAGRASPVRIFVLAQGIAALALLAMMTVPTALWLSTLLAGGFAVSNALSRPTYMWMVTQVAARVRGAMMGINVMANQMGFVLGAALGGLTIAVAGYSELGIVGCIAGLFAAISCRLLVRPERLPEVGQEQASPAPSSAP